MSEHIEERTISGLHILIDRTRCIASKNCIRVAPEVFELGEDNIVTFRDDAEDIDRERLTEACDVCPVEVFTVIDEDGEQILP